MSKHYALEFMSPWIGGTMPEDDPIAAWLSKQYNVTMKMQAVGGDEAATILSTRAAADDMPDLFADGRELMSTLFDQGQVVDVAPLLQYLPQARKFITKEYARWASYKGKMIGVPRYGIVDSWVFFIRKDWLDEFGMKVPTTDEELLAFGKAIVEKKNGKAWLMMSGGGGSSWSMLDPLRCIYGHPGWNVKDGKINHPVLDGTSKRWLEFVKKMYDAQLMPTEWWTGNWDAIQSRWQNDQIGMVHYPGAELVGEQSDARKGKLSPEEIKRMWVPVIPNLTSAGGAGGLYMLAGVPGNLIGFSAKLAKDDGRLKRALDVFDMMNFPNEAFWECYWWGGYNSMVKDGKAVNTFTFWPDGTYSRKYDPEHPMLKDPKYVPDLDWSFMATHLWEKYDPKLPNSALQDEYQTAAMQAKRYQNDEMFLMLPGDVTSRVSEFAISSEVNFVLGKRNLTEWDQYIKEWKDKGGQKLMDQAAKQLGVASA
jgi:putative aldouronate transport system substrate-binding protein